MPEQTTEIQTPQGRETSELSDLLRGGASTAASKADKPLTIEMLNEARELIKALTPKEAPEGAFLIRGTTGLNIMKNDALPENTVAVSKRLFDLIYESSDT
jgi:hypothetical protein